MTFLQLLSPILAMRYHQNKFLLKATASHKMIEKNGKSPWGGCLIFFADHLAAFERQDLNSFTSIESSWIEVSIDSQKLLIGTVYRPPSAPISFLNSFTKVLDHTWIRRKNIILLGDFNINLYNNNSKLNEGDEISLVRQFKNILYQFGLKNLITDPTRVTESSKTLIDIIVSTIPQKSICSGTYDPCISDHNLVYTVVDLKTPKPKPFIKIIHNYKDVDINALQQDFEYIPWSVLETFEDIDDVVWSWNTLYNEVIQSHIKTRKFKVRAESNPWMTGKLRKEMNKRYRLLQKAKKTQKGSLEWQQYKSARNMCTKMLRNAESKFWKDKFESSSSTKEFWYLVKKFQGKSTHKKIGPLKDKNGSLVLKDSEKANVLNTYFANIGEELSKDLDKSNVNPSLISRVTPSIQKFEISKDQFDTCFKHSCKTNKACGADKIKGKDMKLVENHIKSSLFYITTKSYKDSKFPSLYKQAKVTCIHKKGSSTDCGNYRPISLLSIPSKIIESTVCHQIDNHLKDSGILPQSQWGFQKGKSSEHLLLQMTEEWRNLLDNGKVICVLFIDFQKAFDSVSHEVLRYKLLASGISGEALNWILNYLEGRSQFTIVNGEKSSTKRVKYGVVQGSLMGPRLFGCQASDLPESSEAVTEMFADDATGYCEADSLDVCMLKIIKVINDIELWAKRNLMTLHPDKSKVVIISKQNFIGPYPCITMNSEEINIVSETKCLGVIIDNKLSWSSQVNSIAKKFRTKVKNLFQMRTFSTQVLTSIYLKGILPSVIFSILIWGNCCPNLFNKIEKIHILATRYVNRIKKSVPDHRVLSIAKWKDLSWHYKRRLAIMTFQATNDLAPPRINEMVTVRTNQNHHLRNNSLMVVPNFKHTRYKKSFKYRSATMWNALPSNVKNAKNVNEFKKLLNTSNILDKISFGQSGTSLSRDPEHFLYY